MEQENSRRKMIKNLILSGPVIASIPSATAADQLSGKTKKLKYKGRINHSVCRWCFNGLSVEELCIAVKKIGFSAIDLVGPKDWPVLQKHGVYSSMCNGAEISLTEGFNDPQYHEKLIQNYTHHINIAADAGYKDIICFSGSRRGMDDETGLKNCTDGLKKIMSLAEKKGITIHMELLNSKIDHKDYMCDKSPWGIELCKRVGSENFKLLYDIYHMQIDEGDVIRTIKDHHQYFGHYHTAGVPGRHELDTTQELYYPAIMQAVADTGFKGYVAQEFIPKEKDILASLKEAIKICDV